MEDFIIRNYRPGDEVALVQLFERVFHHRKTLNFWRWQFEENDGGVLHVTVAEHKHGEIIGHFGGVVTRFLCQGNVVRVSQGVDVVTHPEHRSLALYCAMTRGHFREAEKKGVGFVYGFPSLDHLKIARRQFGARTLGSVSEWSCKLNWLAQLGRNLNRNREEPREVSIVSRFGVETDTLWNELKNHFPCSTVRDSRYLNWRYADQPDHQYVFLRATDPDTRRVVGLAVIGIDRARPDKNRGLIFELLAAPTDKTTILRLLEFSVAHLAKSGQKRAVVWLPATADWAECARALGFRCTVRRNRPLALGWWNPSIDVSFLEEHFHPSLGESDAF
jgi:hypothetical protein